MKNRKLMIILTLVALAIVSCGVLLEEEGENLLIAEGEVVTTTTTTAPTTTTTPSTTMTNTTAVPETTTTTTTKFVSKLPWPFWGSGPASSGFLHEDRSSGQSWAYLLGTSLGIVQEEVMLEWNEAPTIEWVVRIDFGDERIGKFLAGSFSQKISVCSLPGIWLPGDPVGRAEDHSCIPFTPEDEEFFSPLQAGKKLVKDTVFQIHCEADVYKDRRDRCREISERYESVFFYNRQLKDALKYGGDIPEEGIGSLAQIYIQKN